MIRRYDWTVAVCRAQAQASDGEARHDWTTLLGMCLDDAAAFFMRHGAVKVSTDSLDTNAILNNCCP